MRGLLNKRWSVVTLALLIAASPKARAADFPLKDGDLWVMAGDSITAQHLHSNYFEAFCYARYPNIKFAFRNSGVGGHTIPTTLARFDYDIAAWKPTVVSVELGMNDHGGTPTEKFVANMATMVERIRAINALPVILAASPINDGKKLAVLKQQNHRLQEYADALKVFADKEKIPYADQYHDLVDLWAANKPREVVANAINVIRPLSVNDSVEGVEHLRAFLAVQEKSPNKPVSLMGDPVHPGPPGQLMMAAALLKDLGADGFVSSATIDAKGNVSDSKGCRIDAVKGDAAGLTFDRLDERLPFPIPDDARQVLPLYPTILQLSQYTLTVTGLADGNYALAINGVPTATVSAKDLAAGVNLTAYGAAPGSKDVNPIVAQSRAILGAVNAKEGIVGQWRGLSPRAHAAGAAPDMRTQLADLTKKVEAADEKIRAAAKPQTLHFEIAPAK